MKRITRRQVLVWLAPMRRALLELRNGTELYADGYAMTRSNEADTYERIEYCLRGFAALIDRLWPGHNTYPLTFIMSKLAKREDVTPEQVDVALTWIKSIEKPLMLEPWAKIKDATIVEQIAIEFDAIREAA